MLLALSSLLALGSRVELERGSVLTGASTEWSIGPAGATEKLHLSAILEQSPEQLTHLEERFWAVSTPTNEDYGKHLTQAQVTELVAQPDAVLAAVADWLRSGGATDVQYGPHRDSLDFTVTVASAEALLETTVSAFEHRSRGVTLLRASRAYSVPAALAPRIRMVGGLVQLPSLDHGVSLATEPVVAGPDKDAKGSAGVDWPEDCGSGCQNYVTPAVIAARYSLPAPSTTASKSTLGVSEFQGEVWDQKDLDKFAKSCGLTFKVTVDHENGTISKGRKCRNPVSGFNSCGESLLDIEYAKAIAGGAIPLTDVYSSGYDLLKWATALDALGDGSLPLVMSVSYGNDEIQQTGPVFMQSANIAFQKLGARGMSVLFASGDQGACGRSGCGTRADPHGGEAVVFHPGFPAASPYITAVGGTDFAARSVIGDEKVWNDGGGGFSNTFPIPSYQVAAVAAYMTTAGTSLPPASRWNATGRGYPDVAALAGLQNPYCVILDSTSKGIGGTSAACPVVSAIFARLNDVRLSAGKAPMGFLNPWIYANADAFNDVALGVNDGGVTGQGFPAVKGWDAATGVGTPNYVAMLKAL